MKKRITCLLLPLMLLAFAACGPATRQTNAPEGTSIEEPTVEDFDGITSEFPAEDFTTDGTELESTTDGESVTGETSVNGETTKAEVNAPVGGSATQIVAFYNQYANAVKSAEKITIKKHDKRDMVMDVPAIMKALMPSDAGGMNPNTDETTTETFKNGKGIKNTSLKLNDFLPVSGKPYVSQLKASHAQSATCVKQGTGWVVTIKLKDEPLDMGSMNMDANMSEAERQKAMDEMMSKSGYGSSMDMGFGGGGFGGDERLDSQQAPGNFDPSSMSMDGKYQNGTIVAVFNQQGQLTSLSLSYENNMNSSMMGMKMQMNSTSKQEYQFTW